MEAFGPCLPNNRAGGDFIRFVYLHVDVDTLADVDKHVVFDVGVVVVVDIDVDLPPLQFNQVCSNVHSVAYVDVYVDMHHLSSSGYF